MSRCDWIARFSMWRCLCLLGLFLSWLSIPVVVLVFSGRNISFCQQVIDAWEDMPKEVLLDSLRSCVLTALELRRGMVCCAVIGSVTIALSLVRARHVKALDEKIARWRLRWGCGRGKTSKG